VPMPGRYWFQVGAAAANPSGGYGDRFDEAVTGARVEIRVLSPQDLLHPDTDLSYWVGLDLPNDAFIQVGYELDPMIQGGAATTFWEYFLPGTAKEGTGPFLGGTGDTVGPNASWDTFTIENSRTRWSTYFGQQLMGSVDLGVSDSGSYGPYASAEVAGVNEADNILGPVEFRNLAYRDVNMGWHAAESAVAVCCYSVGSQNLTGRNYPYGVVGVPGENNHWLAGSSVPYAAQGEYLWPWYSVDISSPFGNVSGGGWYVYGSQTTFSISPTKVSASGLLGDLGATMTFVGWSGDYTGPIIKNKLTVDSSKTEVAIWRTEYGPFVPTMAGSSFAAFLLVFLFMLQKVARSRKRILTRSPSMFCPNCGTKILRTDRFCKGCGSRIS